MQVGSSLDAAIAGWTDYYDKAARRQSFAYHTLKLIQLVAAAAIPVIIALSSTTGAESSRAATAAAALGALVVVVEGAQQLFQFQRTGSISALRGKV